MNLQTQATATTVPAYVPDETDLAQMSTIHLIHDLLDVARDLPQEVKWALLDYAAAVLEDDGRAAPAADRTA